VYSTTLLGGSDHGHRDLIAADDATDGREFSTDPIQVFHREVR